MDGYTAVTISFLGFLFVAAVLAAMVLLMARPAPAQPRTVWREPEPHGTAWEPAEMVLSGDWDTACVLADPNTKVGTLRREWLDYHDGLGNVTVEQPKRASLAARQIGTSIRPLVRYER